MSETAWSGRQARRVNIRIGNREQEVFVAERDEVIQFSSVVAHRTKFRSIEDPEEFVRRRNLHSLLVHFQFDERGRLLGHACMPKAGHSADELRFAIERVAVECDRMEFLLTGADEN